MKARAAFLLSLALIAGAITIDHVKPSHATAARGRVVTGAGGVLACPFAVGGAATASALSIANFGDKPARVQITLVGRGKTVTVGTRVNASSLASVRLDGRIPGPAGAIVEYTGSNVAVTHSIVGPSGGGAAPCISSGGADVALSGGRTLGGDTIVSLLNPGSAEADVTITLDAGNRLFAPERLSHVLVPGRSRRDFRVGDFVFDADHVTAVVHANAGRVVAEAVVTRGPSIGLIASQEPSPRLVAIAAATGRGSTIEATAVGQDDAGADARLIDANRQGAFARFPNTLRPGRLTVLPLRASTPGAPAAVSAEVTVGSPIVAGTQWIATFRTSSAHVWMPAAAPAKSFSAVIGVPRATLGARFRLLLVVPGETPANVKVQSLAAPLTDQVLEPGRLTSIPLASGIQAVAIRLESDQPIAAALYAYTPPARGRGLALYAAQAVARTAPASVAVEDDPRAGVPAERARA
jgi:hypothetical protein